MSELDFLSDLMKRMTAEVSIKDVDEDTTTRWMVAAMSKLLHSEAVCDDPHQIVTGAALPDEVGKVFGNSINMLQLTFSAAYSGIVTCLVRGVRVDNTKGGTSKVLEVVAPERAKRGVIAVILNSIHDRSLRGRWAMDDGCRVLYLEEAGRLNGDMDHDIAVLDDLKDFCSHEYVKCLPYILHAACMKADAAVLYIRGGKFRKQSPPAVDYLPLVKADAIDKLQDAFKAKVQEADNEN